MRKATLSLAKWCLLCKHGTGQFARSPSCAGHKGGIVPLPWWTRPGAGSRAEGQEQPPHRPFAGAAAGHGGRGPHHPGAEQPPHQRGPALPRGFGHRGIRRPGRIPRGCLRHGPGPGDSRRAAAAPCFGSSPGWKARSEDGTSRGLAWASPSPRG